MTIQQFYPQYRDLMKMGGFAHIEYQKVSGDYKKITQQGIRVGVSSQNMSNYDYKGKPNENETHILPNLIFNKKTKQFYLLVMVIDNPNDKPKSKYYYQDQEIDKQTYELANPSKNYGNKSLTMFKKNIKDIIALSQKDRIIK